MALLINDHFQNRAQYNIPPAQLVIADIPYNVGKNAYGSNPQWYVDGDNKNGEPLKNSGAKPMASRSKRNIATHLRIKLWRPIKRR